jgi:hypothetical protein
MWVFGLRMGRSLGLRWTVAESGCWAVAATRGGILWWGRYADGPCQFAVDEAEVFDLTFGREPVVKAPVRGSCRSCGHGVNLVVQRGLRVSSGT